MRYRGKVVFAHRLALAGKLGILLADLVGWACHHCDNPACVNPEHLYLGSPKDNAIDRENRGRSNNRLGEDHPMATLTDMEVGAIRAAYTGKFGEQTQLARQYSVTPQLIHSIVRNKVRNPS
jgi:hypothetical protein